MLLEHVRCMRFAGRRQFPVNLAISRSNPAISRSIPAISRSNPAISRSSIATNFCKKSCSWLRSGIGVFKSQFSDTRRGFDMLVGDLPRSTPQKPIDGLDSARRMQTNPRELEPGGPTWNPVTYHKRPQCVFTKRQAMAQTRFDIYEV